MNVLRILLLLLLSLSIVHCEPIELPELVLRERTIHQNRLIYKFNQSIHEQYSYRFVHRDSQRYFTLNSATGELYLRETILPNQQLTLKIFELFHEKLYHLPIRIDTNEQIRPIFPYSSSQIQFHISENSPIYQSKLFIQQNSNHNHQQVNYQLKNIVQNFPFILEINTDLGNRLALVLIQSLDRESIDLYNCSLIVTDINGYYESLNIHIIIDDVNDQSPIFEHSKYSIDLSENTSINTTILRVHAIDNDIGLNSQIVYVFPDASKQFSRIFSIDNHTGDIRLRSSIDYEQRSSFIFYIEARDCGKDYRSSQTLINITIIDENDNAPMIHFRFLTEIKYNPLKNLVQISENYPIDKFFSQILVTDDDSGVNGHVRLWLDDDSSHSFHLHQIDNQTYFLNRTKPFDYEIEREYVLKFYAEDFNPMKPLQTIKTLTIQILDENDHQPKFSQSIYYFTLKENNPKNMILTRIEATDRDQGDNGRITYEIQTNETFIPFSIESDTGIIRCLKSFDREQRTFYEFEIIARDHGHPNSLSNRVPIRIQIDDVNDNPPTFEFNRYEFSIEENWPRSKPIGSIRVFDRDLENHFTYQIQNENTFHINSQGQIFVRTEIDREIRDYYELFLTVSDSYFQTSIQIEIRILDINDCSPQWINPVANRTKVFLNRDQLTIGMNLFTFQTIDHDDLSNGNGLVSYSMVNPYDFLELLPTGELILNSTPSIGKYDLVIQAQDHGQSHQYSSTIQLDLFVGDNSTNANYFHEHLLRINSLSTIKRVLLFSIFLLSIAFLSLFFISLIIIGICRYRKQKYLYYIKCNENQSSSPSSSSTTTGKHLPSSDFYSNCSKHDDITDVDEWTDPNDSQKDWSIEKILYPDWLYRDMIPQTTTFIDKNTKQVRFDYESVRHGLTTTTMMITNQEHSTHHTFI